MLCDEIESKLKAYADGDLAPEERLRVRAHLCECQSCLVALGQIDPLSAGFAQTDAPPVPVGLTSRIMVAARNRRTNSPSAGWNPFLWWKMNPSGMHAVAVAVFTIGLIAGLSMGWNMLSTEGVSTVNQTTRSELLNTYSLDYLNDAPHESLAGAYVALASYGGREKR